MAKQPLVKVSGFQIDNLGGAPEGLNGGQKLAAPAQPADRFYLPELDVLRFFAFSAVFAFHASALLRVASPRLKNIFNTGFFGVDLFFTLSAYLITQLLLRERIRNGTIDVKSFYVRRALRIWPLYFFFLFLAYLPSLRSPFSRILKIDFLSYCFFVGNFAEMFAADFNFTWWVHLWSVSVEEQFYLVWPWAVRKVSASGLTWIAGALFVISALTRLVACSVGATWELVAFGTFSRLDPIAVGIVLATVPRAGCPNSVLTPESGWHWPGC